MTLMKSIILRKTLSIVAKDGIRSFSVKTVAEESGCSEGLIFHYYGNKTNLIDSCYQFVCSEFIKGLEGHDDGTLRTFWEYYCEFMMDNEDMAMFILGYTRHNGGKGRLGGIFIERLNKDYGDRGEDYVLSAAKLLILLGCLLSVESLGLRRCPLVEYKEVFDQILGKE